MYSEHVTYDSSPLRRRLAAYSVALSFMLLLSSGSALAETNYVPRNNPERVQAVVNDLRSRLAIPQDVRVTIVPANARLVSVQSAKDQGGVFLLSMEDAFLGTLSAEELEAVIAHELGHVWIFTHHPFLQTEQLANQIAMRAVTRGSLVKMYEKMWAHTGGKGDLERMLGKEPPAPVPDLARAQPGR